MSFYQHLYNNYNNKTLRRERERLIKKKCIESIISTSKKKANVTLHHSYSYQTKLFYSLLVNGQVSSMIKIRMQRTHLSKHHVYLSTSILFFFIRSLVCLPNFSRSFVYTFTHTHPTKFTDPFFFSSSSLSI